MPDGDFVWHQACQSLCLGTSVYHLAQVPRFILYILIENEFQYPSWINLKWYSNFKEDNLFIFSVTNPAREGLVVNHDCSYDDNAFKMSSVIDGHICQWHYLDCTYWGPNKMAHIWLTTFSKAFSWKKLFVFWLKFHWSFVTRVQLTIIQHCSR